MHDSRHYSLQHRVVYQTSRINQSLVFSYIQTIRKDFCVFTELFLLIYQPKRRHLVKDYLKHVEHIENLADVRDTIPFVLVLYPSKTHVNWDFYCSYKKAKQEWKWDWKEISYLIIHWTWNGWRTIDTKQRIMQSRKCRWTK